MKVALRSETCGPLAVVKTAYSAFTKQQSMKSYGNRRKINRSTSRLGEAKMKLTGLFRSIRAARLAALLLGGMLVGGAMPAEARLSDPPIGGPMSGGFFRGVPMRVAAQARVSESELTGVAGANCHLVRQVVRDRLGASFLRTVQICD
jgi:hypothetical protein